MATNLRKFCDVAGYAFGGVCAAASAYQTAVSAKCAPLPLVGAGCHAIALTVLLEAGYSSLFTKAGWPESDARKFTSWSLATIQATFLCSAFASAMSLTASVAAGILFTLQAVCVILLPLITVGMCAAIYEALTDPNYQPRSWSEISQQVGQSAQIPR